jgi:hypothetical protein
MVGYLEVCAVGSRPLTDLLVRLTVLAEDGSSSGIQSNADVAQSGGLWARARAELDLQRLPRGRYVVVADVLNAGNEIGRVSRSFAIP